MARQVALLRGINVGKTKRIGMRELRDALADAGHGAVRTHLQSGNLVLDSTLSAAKLAAALQRDIAAAFGHQVDVVVRTRAQLAAVVERDPLRDVATDDAKYLVTFLSAAPKAAALRAIEARDVGDGVLVAHGRELYSWHPQGLYASRLARYLSDEHLGVTATGRNWRTVGKLLELVDAD
jgi:uncharacterized protein (DUF1697 family)